MSVETKPSKPIRTDRFEVGDRVHWNIPICMASCRTWYPPQDREYRLIAVKDIETEGGRRGAGHTQEVRVSPNFNKWGDGDEFSGLWFYPIDRATGKSIDHNGRPIND